MPFGNHDPLPNKSPRLLDLRKHRCREGFEVLLPYEKTALNLRADAKDKVDIDWLHCSLRQALAGVPCHSKISHWTSPLP